MRRKQLVELKNVFQNIYQLFVDLNDLKKTLTFCELYFENRMFSNFQKNKIKDKYIIII